MSGDERGFIYGQRDARIRTPRHNSSPMGDPPELSLHDPKGKTYKRHNDDEDEEKTLKELLRQLTQSTITSKRGRDEKLPKFHGKEGEDIEKFFKYVRKVQTYNRWSAERTLEALLLAFQDRAARFYDSLAEQTQKNFGRLQSAFRKEFQPPEEVWLKRSKFYSL